MLELVAISYSAWSEKARWALDYHGVSYEESAYVPMLGQPALRRKLRKKKSGPWRGPISVPLLITADGGIRDSLQIARYAEEIGSNSSLLFPSAHEQDIATWNQRSEVALAAGRAIVTERVLNDRDAQRESMPPMPKALKSAFMRPMTFVGASYLRRKYKYSASIDTQRELFKETLGTLRAALATTATTNFLVGDAFSYADICMAVIVQGIRPVTDEFLKLGPATRRVWTDESLCEEFSDLIDWRDQLYEEHRL